MVSGPTTDERALARLRVCETCTAMNRKGERLYRVDESGKHYCGEPRLGWTLYRDETKDGCGCVLEEKVTFKDAACPLGFWKADDGTA